MSVGAEPTLSDYAPFDAASGDLSGDAPAGHKQMILLNISLV